MTKNRKDKIIRSALELFGQKGFFFTSMQDIAENGNMSVGVIYRYFKNKEKLAWEIFDSNAQILMKQLKEGIDKSTTSLAKIESMIKTCYTCCHNDYELFRFLILCKDSLAPLMPKGYRTPIDLIIEIIKEGQKKGEIRSIEWWVAAGFTYHAILGPLSFLFYGRTDEKTNKNPNVLSLIPEITTSCWMFLKNK